MNRFNKVANFEGNRVHYKYRDLCFIMTFNITSFIFTYYKSLATMYIVRSKSSIVFNISELFGCCKDYYVHNIKYLAKIIMVIIIMIMIMIMIMMIIIMKTLLNGYLAYIYNCKSHLYQVIYNYLNH
jgi:hypothetical protein